MLLTQAIIALLITFVQRPIKVPVLASDKKTHKTDPVTKVPLYKDGKQALKDEDVFSASLKDDTLTVVTTNGQKITKQLTDKELDELQKALPQAADANPSDEAK